MWKISTIGNNEKTMSKGCLHCILFRGKNVNAGLKSLSCNLVVKNKM